MKKSFLVVGLVVVLAGALVVGIGLTYRSDPGPMPLPKHTFSLSHPAVAHLKTSPAPASPTSPTSPASPATPALEDNWLSVPSIGISAPLVTETATTHFLNIPPDVHHVGIWAGGGQISSSTGTVLLAGHIDWYGQGNGAMYPLSTIQPGALIYVSGPTGHVTTWSAVSLSVMLHKNLPQTVFAGPNGPRSLVLITCGGPYTPTRHTFIDNVVARAIPVGAASPANNVPSDQA